MPIRRCASKWRCGWLPRRLPRMNSMRLARPRVMASLAWRRSATGTGTGCNYVYADLQTAINNVSCPNTVLSIAGGVTLGNVALEINGKSNLTIVGLGPGTTYNSPPPACDPQVGCGGGGGGAP